MWPSCESPSSSPGMAAAAAAWLANMGANPMWPPPLEQPLDGLAVGLVAELPRELEDPGGAQRRHPDPPPPPVHLGVAVLVRAPLRP